MKNRSEPDEGRLLRQCPAARRLLYGAVAAGFLATALLLGQTWILSTVIDQVFLQRRTLSDVASLLVGMLLLIVVRAAAIWLGDVLAQRSASRIKDSMRQQITDHIFDLGPAYTRAERSGELVNVVVEGVEALDDYVTQYLPARFLAGLLPIFIFVIILVLDPWSALVLLFAGPMLILLLGLIGTRAKKITERRFLEMSWMSAFFLDVLQGIATLKLFGRSEEQAGTIEEISKRYGNTTMEVLATAFQTSLVMEWAATAATAMVALEISLRLMNGALPFQLALFVLLLTPEFFLPLRQLALKYHAGAAGKAAARRIFAILATQPGTRAADAGSERQSSHGPLPTVGLTNHQASERAAAVQVRHKSDAKASVPAQFDLRFDDVYFAYENGQRPALRGFSLTIPNGRAVALVGATGAGKTTVANLLLRFIEPDRGSIAAGGVPLTAMDRTAWRCRVAWVPQLPYLFHGTVGENLRFARPAASMDEVVDAARAAHADSFIRALPQGYDTPLGERGARLSGGQRQRLAIARAFLKDAPILVLDEATAHLDDESETLIQDALARLMQARTVLIIAHRLKIACAADQIVVMDQGRAVETGVPHTLLAQVGPYAKFAAAQGQHA